MAEIVIRTADETAFEDEIEEDLFPIAFQMTETEDLMELTANVHEFSEEDIEVRLRGKQLIVIGYRGDRGGDLEDGDAFLGFEKSFALPEGVHAEQVKAAIDDGVLIIDIAKGASLEARWSR